MKPHITFVCTGGTFDKDYPVGRAYEFVIGDPAVSRVLSHVNPNFTMTVVSVLRKDSSDINDQDRQRIRKACLQTPGTEIVIIHGTDTMIKTARVLASLATQMRKTIVLTGSTKPQSFKDTDAEFNLGMAVTAVQILPSGVYIAMNGRVYDWDECQKNFKTGQFVGKNLFKL